MTDEHIQQACETMIQIVTPTGFGLPRRHGTFARQSIEEKEHLLFMCTEIPQLVQAGRREKAMRWLGYLQGYLHASGKATLDELKAMNAPKGETLDKERL